MIAVGDQAAQQLDILRIAAREMIAGMAVIALGDRAILAEIVDADHLVAGGQKLLHQIAADEASRAGDQNFHAKIFIPSLFIPSLFIQQTSYGSARQRSTTILPASRSRSKARYCACGVATITMSERVMSSSSGTRPSCGR